MRIPLNKCFTRFISVRQLCEGLVVSVSCPASGINIVIVPPEPFRSPPSYVKFIVAGHWAPMYLHDTRTSRIFLIQEATAGPRHQGTVSVKLVSCHHKSPCWQNTANLSKYLLFWWPINNKLVQKLSPIDKIGAKSKEKLREKMVDILA